MIHIVKSAVLVAALLASPALAKEIKGVQFADTATVDGKELKLNGVGLRRKFVVNVYVAGLYLAEPAKDALSDQTKQVKLVMLRDLSRDQVGDAIREGFEKNSSKDLPKLKERLDKLVNALTEVKKGETLVITYVPDKGTTVASRGKDVVTLEGSDFGQALFAVWLGKSPVDDGLKNGLLGR